MPPRKKAQVIPSSPASSSSSTRDDTPPPKARGSKLASRRRVVESDEEEEKEEEDELAMESPPPTTKATKPASKGKARATPVVEEPRRRSGRLSSRASSASVSQETPVVKGKEMQKKPAISRKPLKVVEQEDEEEKQDATSEDEAESLLDGDEEEDDDPIASPQHPKPKPEPSPTPVDRDATPVPSTPSHRQQGSPTPQPPSPQPSLHAAPPPPSPTPKPKPEGPQKRLIIHKMVLENFKSYAGRQEIGPFHKSFSAIVGPNGSGKSNTIDALLFVFGYRASKMRQGKLGELIHNSEAFPNLGYCKVEVWFKEIIDLPGPDAFRTVPNSSLAVARTAYKDNKSKYTINERNSSYTEVTTLLKDRGIDLTHKRFLILQGEVESIAQMKPKAANEHEEGLLEYLEDIIGTSKYKTPIEEALVEVDGLNEVMGEKKGRLGIVVRELNGLKSKKREAEDFLRDQNELARRNSLLFQWYIYQLRSNIDITETAMTRLKEELLAETEANKGNVAEIGSLEAAYNEQNEIYLDVKKNTEKVMKELASQEKREVQLREKQKHALSQQKKLKKSINEDTHARSAALSWVENHEETIVKTRKELEKLEGKLEGEEKEFEEIRDGLKDKTADFSNQIEVHQRELEPWTAKISEKQAEVDVATSERDLLAKKATGMRDAITEAEDALEKLREGGEGKVDSMIALIEEKKELEKQLAVAEKKLASLGAKGDELRTKVSTYRQRADEAKASLAASKGEDELLSTLNKMKEDGRLQGFSGRLGDLGKIDDKYDVAVTTACGGSLNSLICDTIKQGEAVIDVLRKRKLGRANIMGLDKLPSRDLSPIETPENVPRLFDLVTPRDARFAPAFFKATGNTVVAENLEQANRIAYGKKRWRVVTLGGDLIDTSGAMSGGGTRVQRGGMSSKFASEKVEPAVVAKYDRESEQAMGELTEFTGTRKAVEAEVQSLQRRIPEVEIAMSKIELDVRNGGKRVAEAEKRVRELKSQAKPDVEDERRIAVLVKEITATSKEIDKLRSKSSIIEESIKSLQNQILEVGGVRLRSQKSKVDNTKQQIELAGEKITRAEVDQSKAQKDAEKAEKAIVGNGVKLKEIEGSLGELEGELGECEGDLKEVRETLEKAREGSETMEEELGQLKVELDEKREAISSFRARELDLKQKLEEHTKLQKDNATKHRHWTEKHAELELQYIEDDDDEPEHSPAAAEGDSNAMDQDVKPQFDAEGNPTALSDAAAATSPERKKKGSPLDLEIFSDDVLRELKKDVLIGDVANVEERLSKSKPNMAVLAEYRKRQAEFDERQADLDAVTAKRDAGKKRYDDLRQTRHYEFMAGFNAISSKLKEMYQLITLGGLAELELVDSLDPFSEGIIFSVMPPKKSWKNISNLSGGEKTLSSLALVFALHVFKPTPLYFMDEIDAALDFRNVSIIANYIRERTKSAQFIIISLRSDMFELSHRLVGIYKTNNATKSVAIDNGVLIPA